MSEVGPVGRCGRSGSDRNSDHAGRDQATETRTAAAAKMRAAAESAATEVRTYASATKMRTDAATTDMRTDAATAIDEVSATDTASGVAEMRADTSATDMASAYAGCASAVAEMRTNTGRLSRRRGCNSYAHDRCDHPNRYLHGPDLSWFSRKDVGHCAWSPHLQERLSGF
jgi:hypothetical protein